MNDNENVLNGIIKSSQMGIHGITSVLDAATQPTLRLALKSQRKEYADILRQAQTLAGKLGCRVQGVTPMAAGMSGIMAKGQLLFGQKNSKIAGMMIQGNTRGMIQSLQHMRSAPSAHPAVAELAQKMLETERSNIAQMQGFL